MGGGLMQLVAYGAQDIYLTGNPQITFFKVVYRRHTNFAVEAIEQTINGTVGTTGSKVAVTIARNGDLLSRTYIVLTGLSGGFVSGYDAIDYVEVEIGGQIIDKHYGKWMKIWVDLTQTFDEKAMLTTMLGGFNPSATGLAMTTARSSCGLFETTSTIPLQFWFCRNHGLTLPLIALQYHEVKLNIKLCELVSSQPSGTVGAEVWCDYIFLDTDERRRFAQVSHEYLIEQVQYNGGVDMPDESFQHELRFNHPVKELIWTTTSGSTGCCAPMTLSGAFAGGGALTIKQVSLQLNGHDRFRKRYGHYFSQIQRYEHHSGSSVGSLAMASLVGGGASAAGATFAGDIYTYSFALKPEEHQPSGTCNFSRIDNAVLGIEMYKLGITYPRPWVKLHVYATNYNVLRIMSGMGGLAYSN